MKKKNQVTKLTAIILAMILATISLAGCGTAAKSSSSANKATTVNIALQPSSTFAPFYVVRKNGWLEAALKDQGVTVNWTDFQSGPPMNESFAAGKQDIGVIGDVPAVSAIANGQDNTFIAALEGGAQYSLLVAKDSDIKSLSDLKGKKIGTVTGSTGQNLTEKLLASVNLDINKDVTMVNISTGDAQTVLTDKEVDAVAIWEPNVTRLEDNGTARELANGNTIGFLGVNVIFGRSDFVKNNPDIVKVVLEQYYRGAKALQDDPQQYANQVKDVYSLDTADQMIKTLDKNKQTLVFSDGDVSYLQDVVSFLKEIGSTDKDVTIKDHVDDAIAQQVVKENK